jgi:polyhydroxyalkanoate synthesis repressor PhaR
MSRVIKRYENRKLYDTAQRQYVSFEEIAGLIREGVDVQVVDNNTGDDITTQTLTQVIFEEGKKGLNPLSKDLLHDLIRLGNTIIGGGLQQVRLGLDRLMPDSLNRILGADHSEDLKQLQKRVESLEAIIKALANNTPNKQGEA